MRNTFTILIGLLPVPRAAFHDDDAKRICEAKVKPATDTDKQPTARKLP